MNVYVNARFLTQPITGTQRFAIELSKELKKILPAIKFIAPPSIIHSEIANELGVETFGILNQNLLWEQIELPIYLFRRKNPLLINLCNIAPVLYTNNIVSVLDLSFHLHPEWFSPQFRTLYNFVVPFTAKRARKVITISTNSKNDIATHFGISPSSIDIVYPSISETFKESDQTTDTSNYGKYILSVSSIDPRKNFGGLIKAFKEANLPDTKLLIVGSANKVFADQGLKELIGNNKQIVFTGYVSDAELASLYKNAILFAYPSFFEGFGIPPLEAMAAGCPTLVSNTTSMPEVCGDASLYIDPYNIESIKNGLIKLCGDKILRAQLIKNGYKQVEHFDWSTSAEAMANLIQKLI